MTNEKIQRSEPYIWKVYGQYAGYPAYPGDSDTASMGCEIAVARDFRRIDEYEIIFSKIEDHTEKIRPLLDRYSALGLLAKEITKHINYSSRDIVISKVRKTENRYEKTYCVAPTYRIRTYPVEDREIQIFRDFLAKFKGENHE